jgi:hypothetical protein
MRNEQLQGKISKPGPQQRQNVDSKKNSALSFISFIMQDLTSTSLDQQTVPITHDATLFDNTDSDRHLHEHLTVFQLSEDEILKEMLTHLAADCPVMMQNKENLIAKLSSQYDNLNVKNMEKYVLDTNQSGVEDANVSDHKH